jgi:hypothetical protein
VAYENNKSFGEKRNMESIFSKRVKAGKRRTYFFDVRETRGSDYFITITESKKRFNDDGYDRHKMFIYKEDFNKFLAALTETVDYVKTDLMPDFDFDSFSHEDDDQNFEGAPAYNSNPSEPAIVQEESLVEAAVVTDNDPEELTQAAEPIAKESAISSTADDLNVDDWKI